MTKFYLTFDYTHVNLNSFNELMEFETEMKYSSIIENHIVNALFFSMRSLSLIVSIEDMAVDLNNCIIYLQTYATDEDLKYMINQWDVSNITVQGVLDNSFSYVANHFKINEINSNNNAGEYDY